MVPFKACGTVFLVTKLSILIGTKKLYREFIMPYKALCINYLFIYGTIWAFQINHRHCQYYDPKRKERLTDVGFQR